MSLARPAGRSPDSRIGLPTRAGRADGSTVASLTTPAGTLVKLGVKIAIASGPVRRYLAGDPAVQRIDVLAGAVLNRPAAAEHLPVQGEVMVAADTARKLGRAIQVSEWRRIEKTGLQGALLGSLSERAPELPSYPISTVRCCRYRWVIKAACCQVCLAAGGPQKAKEILMAGCDQLQQQAGLDEGKRPLFLENVPLNREFAALCFSNNAL